MENIDFVENTCRQQGDTYVCYFLRTPPFLLFGLDTYALDIYFNKDKSFKGAKHTLYNLLE